MNKDTPAMTPARLRRPCLSQPTRAVILAACYVLGGLLGSQSGSGLPGHVPLVWAPSGIAVAAILLFGSGMWWGVALGSCLFTMVEGQQGISFMLCTALGNTVGALLCAYLLERFNQFRFSMDRIRDVGGFILFACLLGTTVNAAFNVVGLCYAGHLPFDRLLWQSVFNTMSVWWVPNAMGLLVVAPLILGWATPDFCPWPRRRFVEAFCCAGGLLAGTQLSFNSWFVYGVENYPLAYLPYPFLVWGALRFGLRGAATGTAVVAGISIYQLLHQQGPFWAGRGHDQTSLTLMGCYIAVVAVGNLLLAAAVLERQSALRATLASEKRLQDILHAMPDGVIVLDEHQRISLFNPAAEIIFQFPARNILQRPLADLFAAGEQEKYAAHLQCDGRPHQTAFIELTGLQPDGATVPVDVAFSSILEGAAPSQIVVVRDISKRRKLEEQYRQSQKMEAVGRLAGGIAHDFNNLMQAILGYSNLLDRRLPLGDPNRDAVDHIQKSMANAASLTRQLLAFSRKQVLTPKLLLLNNTVTEMTHLLQRVLGENIQLSINLADPAPSIRADQGQIEQIILNLAINARDAMTGSGILGIETSHVVFKEETAIGSGHLPPGSYALLKISDTGCGMTAEVQAHLFEPFFTTKDNGKGTGLGLSNVYGAVKQSEGEIAVITSAGHGTTFEIYLPSFTAATTTAAAPAGIPGPVLGTETVLLVEDEEVVRLMLVEVLQAAQYKVMEAKDGATALALAADHSQPIHLLVTDMTMPGLSGAQLAERLSVGRAEMRVLFITGYSNVEAAQMGAIHPNARFLQKPFHPDAFLAMTRQVLDHSERELASAAP